MFIEDKEDKVFIPQTKHTITASDYNQIKNEIQGAIELAGMEPKKDVIQFPAAVKKMTEQSGAAELAKITAEGTKQVGAVSSMGATQKAAVESAGAEQVAAVVSSGAAQLNKVQKAGSEQVAAAKNWASKTDGPVEGDLYSAKKYAQNAAQSAQNSRGLAIGQLVWSQSSLAKDNPGCLPGWTGEYYPNAAALYPVFYAWVKSHPALCKTKAQYDEALSAYGECSYYVADEVAGSLRLPKYKNTARYLIKKEVSGSSWYNLYSDGWLEQGGYFANPQTIGTGAITETFWKPYAASPTLLFGNMSTREQAAYDSEHYPYDVTATGFTHKNIQPNGQGTRWYAVGFAADTPIEKIRYLWICAYNAATPASTAQAAEFIGALSGKANTDLSNVLSTIDYVVEAQVLSDGSWYRKYKSGWIEQGGLVNVANATVTFPKPFSAVPATLLLCSANTVSAYTTKPTAVTVTSFGLWQYQGYYNPCYWYACGQGAEEE